MWFAVQQASDKEESDFVETRHQASDYVDAFDNPSHVDNQGHSLAY